MYIENKCSNSKFRFTEKAEHMNMANDERMITRTHISAYIDVYIYKRKFNQWRVTESQYNILTMLEETKLHAKITKIYLLLQLPLRVWHCNKTYVRLCQYWILMNFILNNLRQQNIFIDLSFFDLNEIPATHQEIV